MVYFEAPLWQDFETTAAALVRTSEVFAGIFCRKVLAIPCKNRAIGPLLLRGALILLRISCSLMEGTLPKKERVLTVLWGSRILGLPPPCKQILMQTIFRGVIFGAITTMLRNQWYAK